MHTTVSAPVGKITCTVTDTANECWLRIEGALDTHTAPEMRSLFDGVVAARRPRVIIDLERLTTVDSSGVGAIVSIFKRVKAYGGVVVVKGVQNQPLAVCRLLKLDRVFGS